MKENWKKLQDWWLSTTAKEKMLIKLMATLISVFFVYQLIWSPYVNHVDTLRNQLIRNKDLLTFMKSADKTIRHAEKNSEFIEKTKTKGSILGLLQKQIEKYELTSPLTQLKQGNRQTIEMHFQKINFDKLILFLIKLNQDNDMSVQQIVASSISEEGLVNADLVLKGF